MYREQGTHGDPSNTTASQQGRIIRNAFMDLYEFEMRKKLLNDPDYRPVYNSNVNPATSIIREGELCVSRCGGLRMDSERVYKKRRLSGHSSHPLDDGAPAVFSSINGLGILATGNTADLIKNMDDAAIRETILSNLEFEGIAQIDCDFSEGGVNKHSRESSLPLQIGGINSIVHTADDGTDIFAGSTVVLDLPRAFDVRGQFIRGNVGDKQLFVTKRLDPKNLINTEAIMALYKDVPDNLGVIDVDHHAIALRSKGELAQFKRSLWYKEPKNSEWFENKGRFLFPRDERDEDYGMTHYCRALTRLIIHTLSVYEGFKATENGANKYLSTTESKAAYIRKYAETVQQMHESPGPVLFQLVREVLFPSKHIETLLKGVPRTVANVELAQKYYSRAYLEFSNAQGLANARVYNRVIGRAKSAAAPGHQFDIYIGQGYCLA